MLQHPFGTQHFNFTRLSTYLHNFFLYYSMNNATNFGGLINDPSTIISKVRIGAFNTNFFRLLHQKSINILDRGC